LGCRIRYLVSHGGRLVTYRAVEFVQVTNLLPNRIGRRLHKVAADEAGNLCGVGVGLRGLRVEILKIDLSGNLLLQSRIVVAREPVDYGVAFLPGATLPFGFDEAMGLDTGERHWEEPCILHEVARPPFW
jgi:hypothetical protein